MMLLLTGASGAGKSTVRALIAAELAPEVRTVELTQIAGPPTWERGWRQWAVERVVQVALAEQEAGRHLLLAGDPVPPGEVLAAPSADRLDGFATCLLDCGPEEQERRLRERGDPEDLLPHHLAFAEWMREHARDPHHRLEVIDAGWEEMRWDRLPETWDVAEIDVTELSSDEAAAEVLAWVRQALAAEGR